MGTMGAPMARNLLKAGHSVVVHNRTRAREEPLAEEGIVLSCVSDTPDVQRVLLDGDTGAINGLREGGLVIDCSSIAPAATREIAATFAAKGIGYVDAPVSGGSEGAIKGTLAIMCGGSEADFARATPVLEVLGAQHELSERVGAAHGHQAPIT